MKTLVILATICSFFGMTAHTSSIRAEETWEKIKEGPDKGSYKGKLWEFDALARFEDDKDRKFVKFTVYQKYSSEEAAVETCERVGALARKVISGYGPFDGSAEFSGTIDLGIEIGPLRIQAAYEI